MIRYSDEIIEEVRQNNDVVDIISQYVVLKRSGRNFFGLCPFHKEKSPSFGYDYYETRVQEVELINDISDINGN